MRTQSLRIFIYSAIAILFVSAIGKFISSGSNVAILDVRDPLFLLPFRYMLRIAGGLELAAAFICLNAKKRTTQAAALAWLSTNFLLYRIGLWLVHYDKPCSCMGSLADGLHISAATADRIMRIVLAYLSIGSYAALLFLNKRRQRNISALSEEKLKKSLPL